MSTVWGTLLGVGVGIQFASGAWYGFVVRPLWVDSDLATAWQIISGGSGRMIPTLLASEVVLMFGVLATGVAGLRSVGRRFSSYRAVGAFFSLAVVSAALFVATWLNDGPGGVLTFAIYDVTVPTATQLATEALLGTREVLVAWVSFALSVGALLAGTLALVAGRSRSLPST